MLVLQDKVIVFSSDIGRYLYCPMQIYMELKYGKIETQHMVRGTQKHKEIELREKEGTEELKEVQTLSQALEMSKYTSDVIQSVDEYKMREFFDGVILVGKPDLIAAHKNKIIIVERKPYREGGIRKGELLQVVAYAMLAQKETRIDYDRIECYLDLYDRDTSQIVKRERVPLLPQYTYEVKKILRELYNIANGKIPNKTNNEAKCKFCPYKKYCSKV